MVIVIQIKQAFNSARCGTDTPIQDESVTPVQDDTPRDTTMSNVVTEEENYLLDDEEDNVSIVSSQ